MLFPQFGLEPEGPPATSTMAEISESSNPAEPSSEISETPETPPQVPASDFDPKTMRTTKPGLKRLFLTLSVLLSFLLCFPFLWKSVEIYRSPLPFEEMDTLSKEIESNPLQFPCQFQAIFIDSSPQSSFSVFDPQHLHQSILAQMTKLTSQIPQCGTCSSNFNLSVTVDFVGSDCTQSLSGNPSCLYECGTISGVGFDFGDEESVDDVLESVLGDRCSSFGGKVYSVVVVNRDDFKGARTVVGKYRHSWIVGRDLEAEATVEKVAEIFVKVFAHGGREEGLIHGEFMPVGADGRIVLSFNLLNANPRDWIYDW